MPPPFETEWVVCDQGHHEGGAKALVRGPDLLQPFLPGVARVANGREAHLDARYFVEFLQALPDEVPDLRLLTHMLHVKPQETESDHWVPLVRGLHNVHAQLALDGNGLLDELVCGFGPFLLLEFAMQPLFEFFQAVCNDNEPMCEVGRQ